MSKQVPFCACTTCRKVTQNVSKCTNIVLLWRQLEGQGFRLQKDTYFCLRGMPGGSWKVIKDGFDKCWTRLQRLQCSGLWLRESSSGRPDSTTDLRLDPGAQHACLLDWKVFGLDIDSVPRTSSRGLLPRPRSGQHFGRADPGSCNGGGGVWAKLRAWHAKGVPLLGEPGDMFPQKMLKLKSSFPSFLWCFKTF